jgi:SprT protein
VDALKAFLPVASFPKIKDWINELDVQIKITPPRKTKLGDFKVVKNSLHISINNDLNPYSFLITLTHELAHAFVYKEYKNKVLPHGNQWKDTFKNMLLNFIPLFPDDIAKVVSSHLLNPKASSGSDIKLATVLRQYDDNKGLTISAIMEGELFSTPNGKIFKKGIKLRKRYRCVECTSNKVYLFHPLAEVVPIQ